MIERRAFLGSFPNFWAAGGAPDFVIGGYQLPKQPDAWREIKQAGWGVVRCEAKREELDEAGRAGLKAWVAVGSDPARIATLVHALKDHPALLFWETEDEPSYQYKKPGARVTPERMIAAYRAIKALDPARPVYVNHSPTNTVATLAAYNPCADILATDVYPVGPHGLREQYALWPDGLHGDLLNPYISQVGQYADKLRQVAGPARSLYMVLQAFAWEGLRKEGDRDARRIQYPTREELRFMCFQSIIHGATGLLFWGLHTVPRQARFWADLKAVTAELRAMERDLSAPAAAKQEWSVEYHDTGHTIDRGIEMARKGSLMLAVNADRWPVECTIHGRRLSFTAFGSMVL